MEDQKVSSQKKIISNVFHKTRSSAYEQAIHLVSAWSHQNRLVLGQGKTEGKSNEIAAVKELLTLLDIRGAVITTDAMSCQKEIVKQICDGQADYIIAVKDNQKKLRQGIEYEFKTQSKIVRH
ncbi:MAG: ISAs1 family transposase, partial [Bacteroidia bacterium]